MGCYSAREMGQVVESSVSTAPFRFAVIEVAGILWQKDPNWHIFVRFSIASETNGE
jgi:hypothetical protein